LVTASLLLWFRVRFGISSFVRIVFYVIGTSSWGATAAVYVTLKHSRVSEVLANPIHIYHVAREIRERLGALKSLLYFL